MRRLIAEMKFWFDGLIITLGMLIPKRLTNNQAVVLGTVCFVAANVGTKISGFFGFMIVLCGVSLGFLFFIAAVFDPNWLKGINHPNKK